MPLIAAGLACVLDGACVLRAAAQQEPSADAASPLLKPEKKHKDRKHAPDENSGPHPWASIPLSPLGFASPNVFYLGDRLAQVSLDFLDEEELLFTFRVPGLIPREHAEADRPAPAASDADEEERNIRALVLALPSGRVTAESTWRLHDFAPYLWMLDDGKFLLRDRKELLLGDSALRLEPYLRFPGLVKYVELDPRDRWLVAQSVEPLPADAHANHSHDTLGSDIASNRGAAAPYGAPDEGSVLPQSQAPAVKPQSTETLLRVLRLQDRTVLLALHTESGLVHVPIDGEGFYDSARGRGLDWRISYRTFTGSEEPMLTVDSTCTPALDTLAPGVVLVSACAVSGGRELTAMTREGHRLWEFSVPATRVWPMLARSRDGLRLARATLDVNHPIEPTMPLDPSDIHGETVQVFDVATGKVALTGPASPVLDGGRGFALSPSGRRFAVLNEGAIQVYELAAAPPLPHQELSDQDSGKRPDSGKR